MKSFTAAMRGSMEKAPGFLRQRLPRRNLPGKPPVADQRSELGLCASMAKLRGVLQVLERGSQILRDAKAGGHEQREQVCRVPVAFLRGGSSLRDRLLIAHRRVGTPLRKHLAIDRDPSHDRCDSSRVAPCARAC
jgi:hypothetical protein